MISRLYLLIKGLHWHQEKESTQTTTTVTAGSIKVIESHSIDRRVVDTLSEWISLAVGATKCLRLNPQRFYQLELKPDIFSTSVSGQVSSIVVDCP